MNIRTLTFMACLLLVVLAAMGTITAVQANDVKVFPGAECQTEFNVNYGDSTPPAWSLWGGAYSNTHTSFDHVICPITRDRTRNRIGTRAVEVRIYNPDPATGRGFWCELWSHSIYGGAGPTVPGFPFALESNHVDAAVLGLSTLSLDTSVSAVGGYYSLHCEVPPGGYIYDYQVTEFDPNQVD